MAVKYAGRRISTVIAAIGMAIMGGCSVLNNMLDSRILHDVSMTCTSPTPGSLQCRLKSRGINSVGALLFWSKNGEPLWAISFKPRRAGPEDLAEILYGVLPLVSSEPYLR